MSNHFRWIEKHDAVCPMCHTTGHLEYQEDTWDHRCLTTRQRWTWSEYRAEVRTLVAQYQGFAA